MSSRRFSVKFSGVASDAYHDGQMEISYFNVFANANADSLGIGDWNGGKVEEYDSIFSNFNSVVGAENSSPMIQSYKEDSGFNLTDVQGLCSLEEGSGAKYSVYRREYEIYERPGRKIYGYYDDGTGEFYEDSEHKEKIIPRPEYFYIDDTDPEEQILYRYDSQQKKYKRTERAREYIGDWKPVLIRSDLSSFYDFNIESNRTYQYIMYPADQLSDNNDSISDRVTQIYANSVSDEKKVYYVWKPGSIQGQGSFVKGRKNTSNMYGEPLSVSWNAWSICELEPVNTDDDMPIVKKTYKVNLDQTWVFKYSLETGSQNQNISRNEIETLGQFPKMGYGESDYISGSVEALLGSEIVPYSKYRYIERLKASRVSPLSTNEKTEMLRQWRKLVGSKNPKLLRDIKGQSWIVHITSSSNSPKNFYYNQPDTISFEWKQIEDTENMVIYSEVKDIKAQDDAKGEEEWTPVFKMKEMIR